MPSLLYVDDDPTQIVLGRELFKGYEFHAASNAFDGFMLYTRLDPDILITDNYMTSVTGSSLALAVRAREAALRHGAQGMSDDLEFWLARADVDKLANNMRPGCAVNPIIIRTGSPGQLPYDAASLHVEVMNKGADLIVLRDRVDMLCSQKERDDGYKQAPHKMYPWNVQ